LEVFRVDQRQADFRQTGGWTRTSAIENYVGHTFAASFIWQPKLSKNIFLSGWQLAGTTTATKKPHIRIPFKPYAVTGTLYSRIQVGARWSFIEEPFFINDHQAIIDHKFFIDSVITNWNHSSHPHTFFL